MRHGLQRTLTSVRDIVLTATPRRLAGEWFHGIVDPVWVEAVEDAEQTGLERDQGYSRRGAHPARVRVGPGLDLFRSPQRN